MKAKPLLLKLNACPEAIDWVGDKTIQEAWETCPRGDWMLWFYKMQYPDNLRELSLAKGHCANTVRHLMKDYRSLKAVDTAIAFGEGRTTREELAAAAYASYSAASVYADDAASAYSAYAAEAAAYSAYASAYSAEAAYSAYSAYAAEAAAAAAAAKLENRQQTADICRKYLRIDL